MSVPSPQDPAAPGKTSDPSHQLPAHATDESIVITRRSGWGKWIILAVILIAIALVIFVLRRNKAADEQEAQRSAAAANRPVPVQTVAVQQRTVPVFLSALGTVTAYNTVTLHTRVDGQLLQVNFTEGQQVHKGQLLLQIDPRPYQATLDQAIGTLAKDEANLKNMQAEAQRYTALYEAGVVSKESQQSQVSNAGQAEGSIKADQAAIEAARVNLGYTRIYAPIDGVVGLRLVDPGNIVHASDSTGLVVITQVKPIAVVFTLPEDQLPLVQQAMRGANKLVVEAYDRSDAHKIASGTLLTIDNQIDTTTGTAKLKAVFQNEDGGLFANQFVNVRLILRQRENATVIPTAAIQSGTQGDYVFVVNPGPTPANKRQNVPGAQGASGGKGTHNGGKSTAGNSSAAPAGAPEGGGKGNGGQGGGCKAGPNHADQVPVHVDFVIGTMSVIGDNELKTGQPVIVDGQEKLVDGSNVCPQEAHGQPGAQPSAAGNSNHAGGLTQGTTTPVPPDGAQTYNNAGPGSTVSSGGSQSAVMGSNGNASGSGAQGASQSQSGRNRRGTNNPNGNNGGGSNQ